MDPDPWGGPWRLWDEIDPGEAEARGIYAPVHALSDSATGAIVIAPGDVRGTRLIPDMRGGGRCGLDGADGPNSPAKRATCPWRPGSTTARSGRQCASARTPCAVSLLTVSTQRRSPGRSRRQRGRTRPRWSPLPRGEDGPGRAATGRGVRNGRRQQARRPPTCWRPPTGSPWRSPKVRPRTCSTGRTASSSRPAIEQRQILLPPRVVNICCPCWPVDTPTARFFSRALREAHGMPLGDYRGEALAANGPATDRGESRRSLNEQVTVRQ